jgi:hypothetical protein
MIEHVDIPEEQWPQFFRWVNRHSISHPVHLEVEQRELGDQDTGALQPFRGIELEVKGTLKGAIVIMVGTSEVDHSHYIPRPIRVVAGHNEAAEVSWLAIQEESGITILYFEHLKELAPESGPEEPAQLH